MDDERPTGGGTGDAPLPPTVMKTGASTASSGGKVRFTPGSMLGDRYRIVALLGKGGMGEVYRAEDVRLGQQVALKFLPGQFASEDDKLRRLYDEVRLGRQVSHPNVCRMYDVAEIDGHHFIAMEYIDGEDLASLLRRIGRLPHDKALDLARDLCAGLAAAHGLGIIHRDLKPANVMIDGRGDARITDFGLAALAADLEARREIAGTPAYMAPEQLSGGEVSHKTDLYALGLIFYEMFTGKRLFQGETLGEIVSAQSASSSQSISRETSALDPAIQRVLVRCLEPDPAKRPASIHSVIAALPGGDPLQAAIDAGETPSPEMIAAAGSTGELRPSVAWPLLLVTLLVVLAAAALSSRVRLYGQTDLPLQGVELAIRARQVLATAGVAQRPEDTAWEFGVDPDYRLWKREQNESARGERAAAEKIFSPLLFGYRESATTMETDSRVWAFRSEPALEVGGMGQVFLQPDGRLSRIVIVPPEDAGPPVDASPDWAPMFEAAGLGSARAAESAPRWRPPVGSDRRFAWTIVLEGWSDPVRVEAASLAGKPVWFEVFAPWKRAVQPFSAMIRPLDRLFDLVFMVVLLGTLAVGGFLANRNLRRGRGNKQGAWRLAMLVGTLSLISAAFMSDHFAAAAVETAIIFNAVSGLVFVAATIWVWYLALEPYLRRRWPATLISWNRVLQGRWLDPLVGRDILLGVLAGASIRLAQFITLAAPSWLGWQPPVPADSTFLELTAWKYTLGYAIRNPVQAIGLALAWMVVLLIAHLVFRQRWIAIGVVILVVVSVFPGENYPLLEWPLRLLVGGVVAAVMVRFGLVALVATMFVMAMFDNFPVTLDPTVWYFDRSLLALAILIGLAVFGFVRALGQHAVFGAPVLED